MPFPHVAHVDLNRPKKLNAFNTAVVLSGGSAKGFTAGLDLGEDAARVGLLFMQLEQGLQESLSVIEKCRQPVIAARLPKVVGNQSWVHDVCLTARNFGAKEAFEFQLVSEVVEGGRTAVLECAFKKAVLIAEKSPVAVVGIKNVLKYSRDHSVEDGLNYVGVWNASAIQTEDVMRAAGAAMSKTKATFSKL
ncbi:hypothetical protein HDU78_000518 [Chytriomyces hyalinus]|nr:hypothetical protein HDU78_000518 [Chytriomyces hyalinus]